MAMITCPECLARISDKATTCPHCGYTYENGLIPISQTGIVPSPRIVIPEIAVFESGMNLMCRDDNDAILRFIDDANEMQRLAPGIAEVIMGMISTDKEHYVAEFSKKAEELRKKGELVFSVDKDTGDLLPQLRNVDTGRIYEKARIKVEDVPEDILPSLTALQTQMMIMDMMSAIESVAQNVEALRLENQADRIAEARSVWQQLEQASEMTDGHLRAQKILDVATSATNSRCRLEENFDVQKSLLASGKGRAKDKSQCANTAMTDLSVIALMAKTEYAAYCLIDEPKSAAKSLEQFSSFIEKRSLQDRRQLVWINDYCEGDRQEIIDGFTNVGSQVLELQADSTNDLLLPRVQDEEHDE